jgi:hypothetical protein
LSLRKAIGILGIALPFVLAIGKFVFDGPGIKPSISDYYYTSMRDVFVGTLCAIGIFLFSYRGYEFKDDLAGDLACLFAVGVALFPTTPGDNPSAAQVAIGYLHYGCAACFFLILAYFSLVLFRKTGPGRAMTRRKTQRNAVYAACGVVMLACIGLLSVYGIFLRNTWLQRMDPVFWLEAIAIWAFGLSWLTKGNAILQDDPPG